mgnify:CR=1 FL=1
MNTSALVEALKKYDFSFFGICAAIFLMGVVNLYSATHASSSDHMANLYKVQLGWYAVSLLAGVLNISVQSNFSLNDTHNTLFYSSVLSFLQMSEKSVRKIACYHSNYHYWPNPENILSQMDPSLMY